MAHFAAADVMAAERRPQHLMMLEQQPRHALVAVVGGALVGEDRHRPETAHYVCEGCGTLWPDATRNEAVSHGYWEATGDSSGIAGFHIPAFLSPWVRLEDVVREFLDAKDRPELLQVWVNIVYLDDAEFQRLVDQRKAKPAPTSSVQNR